MLEKCSCEPVYHSRCNQCEGDGCWACDEGWTRVDQSEYLVDRNTERTFVVTHQRGCECDEPNHHQFNGKGN